jgi:DNA-binding YbaB/EbfC family protein
MNIQKMMKQAQEMQAKMADMQAKLESEEAEGSSGGGMVRVRINGKNMMLKVTIDDSLMKPDEKEVLEDLLIAAYNDARGKIDATTSDQMGQITSGLNLPPGFKMPF